MRKAGCGSIVIMGSDQSHIGKDRSVGADTASSHPTLPSASTPTTHHPASPPTILALFLPHADPLCPGKPTQNLYGMTKGTLAQLTKSCAVQFAPEGITVNCVCPGVAAMPSSVPSHASQHPGYSSPAFLNYRDHRHAADARSSGEVCGQRRKEA